MDMSKFQRPKTKDEYIKAHRDMWYWISKENINRKKQVFPYDYFKAMGVKNPPIGYSFLCEYNDNANRMKKPDRCKNCLIKWENLIGKESERCLGSIYTVYYQIPDDNYTFAADIARRIANLHERN